MFWADELVENIIAAHPGKKRFIVRDEKTASGRVHVGSLRGVVIHGIIAQALQERGFDAQYYYEINDADPMDGMPVYLDKKFFDPFMGRPLKDVSSPTEKTAPGLGIKPAENFARYFGDEFVEVIRELGFSPKIYLASAFYAEGKFDHWIDLALEGAQEIRRIYKEVSGSEKQEEWNPVQVVCEKCGKVGTTTVVGFSGERGARRVEYRCEPNKVKWAVGCGYSGAVSPYKGRGKLPWKVEWAAKWQIFPVDIEGAGKDHSVVGGSREVAARIALEVFNGLVPFNIPYEFFTFGGSKMSASKGIGASSREVADTLPPELARFSMVRAWPNQVIDFDTGGDTIPRLFDAYDESAAAFFGKSAKENAADLARVYHFSLLDTAKTKEVFLPRFSRVAFLMQIPSLDFSREIEKLKGAPLTKEDRAAAEGRAQYAKVWLGKYAPPQAKFEVQHSMPARAAELSADQKAFLRDVGALIESKKNWKGEELHAAIHEIRKKSPLEAREGFSAIYVALLGKDSGPQAGWFLESLEKDFVVRRFKEVAASAAVAKALIPALETPYVIIAREVRERFPGIKVGFAVLRGITVTQKREAELDERARTLWHGLDFTALKKSSARLEAFKDIYRGFGVKPSNVKPSPVALVTRLANGKTLPHINAIVDIGNMLSVKHQLAVGLFNLDALSLPLKLGFANGGEPFIGLGTDKEVSVMRGELCYFDGTGFVVARDFNHLDSQKTGVTVSTRNILMNVDGNQACTLDDVQNCLQEIIALVQEFCGGTLESAPFIGPQ